MIVLYFLFLLSCHLIQALYRLHSSEVNWISYTPKYLSPKTRILFKTEEAHVLLPSFYNSVESKKLTIRIRRFLPSSDNLIKRVVWLVAGGPGGHSDKLEASVESFWNTLNPLPVNYRPSIAFDEESQRQIQQSTAWYFMDHRGTGKSTKLWSAKGSQTAFWSGGVKELPVPITCFTPDNAAKDLASLAWYSVTFAHPLALLYGLGQSYGTFVLELAHQGMLLSLGFGFKGMLMDGLAPKVVNLSITDIRWHLAELCVENEECTKVIANPISIIPNIMFRLQSTTNQCTRSIRHWTRVNPINGENVLRALVEAVMRCSALNDDHKPGVLLSIMLHGLKCLNPVAMSHALNYMSDLGCGVVIGQDGKDVSLPLSNPSYKDSKRRVLNPALFTYITWSEWAHLLRTQVVLPETPVASFYAEMDRLNSLGKHVPSPIAPYIYIPERRAAESKDGIDKLIVIASKLDTQTPHDDALHHVLLKYKSLNSSSNTRVYFYSFNWTGHVSLMSSQCAQLIMRLFLSDNVLETSAYESLIEECVMRVNNQRRPFWSHLDQEFRELVVNLGNVENESIPGQSPEYWTSQFLFYAQERNDTKPKITLWTSLLLYVVALVVCLALPLGHLFFLIIKQDGK